MADEVTWTQLAEKLKQLDDKVAQRAMRTVGRRAMSEVRDTAKANAPKDPYTNEDISKNIVIRNMSTRNAGKNALGWRVGVLGGAKGAAEKSGEIAGSGKDNPGGDTFYWRFIEFGFTHKSGKVIPAKPFMRNALKEHEGGMLDKFQAELKKAVDKAISKL